MKSPILLIASLVLFITGCSSNTTKEFIAGTYVSEDSSNYSMASDTLEIEESTDNNYFIHRKTGFRLIRNGKKGKRQYETEEWKALYDTSTKSLMEISKGKIITFYPKENKLAVGKREYKKIN
ncbi:hypothetical protein SAMN04488511_11970 [Pedobacter suwonensis]|uniref:MORN repeat variant n=1 Tax=Pedobacter suwonensis TaxID=332999 RepID=A0A1I0U3R3_9SPHI|nr:hypothetical protein [Pedobacter suwonensis]SFA58487.1 hypothetical protein SAMN04488511_11970 [Pedobacter suwonensis]